MIANIAQAYDLEIAAGTQDNGVGASVQDAQRTWVFFLGRSLKTARVLTVSFRQSSQNENASRGTAKYFRAMLHCDGGYWLAVANSDVELFWTLKTQF
jgi:type IV pilus biogenesis protein CpaD/CtpE